MNRDELIQSWAITRSRLDIARWALPPFDSVLHPLVVEYEKNLSHNELELAFDALEAIGNEIDLGALFWNAMYSASENMGLSQGSARCHEKLITIIGEKLQTAPELETELNHMISEADFDGAMKRLQESTGCYGAAKSWVDGKRPQNKPCPFCSSPLRTEEAQQCFSCGMDWHDPNNIVRHE